MKVKFKEKSFFEKAIFIILLPAYFVEILLIYFYRFVISPFLPHVCKYTPSCSKYFLLSLKEYGVFKGTFFGIKRFLKCNPFSKGGIDPVKPNIKGNIKWIL